MAEIKTNTIEKAIYDLCIQANVEYDNGLYKIVAEKYRKETELNKKNKLANILKNIKLAHKTHRPLCQDTGQVIVFAEIGQQVCMKGKNFNQAINDGIAKAYKENFFRLSIVKNALFSRTNTLSNTPAIIYTEITDTDYIKLQVLIKGAGAENYSTIRMFKPTFEQTEIFDFVKETIQKAGEKVCPPIVVGIGAGGTIDSAAILSKKAFFNKETKDEKTFKDELKAYLNDDDVLEIKLLATQSHIATAAVAVTINCHSTRHAECTIKENEIITQNINNEFIEIKETDSEQLLKEIQTSDIEAVKNLQKGETILLTGEIYTARDAAHQRISDLYKEEGNLPFELKDKIIFYAGPCPATPDEIIGPIGPTTSARMDKFNDFMNSQGVLGSIGKGERDAGYHGRYFTITGGISCLLEQKVKSCEIIAFGDLGTEAVRKLYVEKLPVIVEN